MSRNPKIEEMAKVLCEDCATKGKPCPIRMCDAVFENAEALYNADYRKASEVAREVCAEVGERFKSLLEMLPADGALTDAKTFIEAHWEFIENSIVSAYDAELKKKYTEGGEC